MGFDVAGRQAFNTVFGEATVGWRKDSISAQFQYNISTNDVSITSSGSGAGIHSSSRAGATVGAAVGDCVIQSVDSLRYRPGHEVTAQFTSAYVGLQSGVKHYHGVLDAVDGFAFGSKDGVFGIWFISNSGETFYPQSSWLGDKLDGSGAARVLDPTALNIYQVQYGWLGIAPATFSVYCGVAIGWVVVHWVDLTNTQSTPHIKNPALPMRMRTVRASGTGTSSAVYCGSMRAGVVSGEEEENASNRWFSHTTLEATIAGVGGTRYNVVSLSNPTAFQGRPNHVTVELGIATYDNSGNKTLAFYATKGATLTGAGAAVPKDSLNSVISTISGGTVTGGVQGAGTVVRKDAGLRTELLGTGVLIYPGETLTIEAGAATAFTGTLSNAVRWVEYF
jgi:hypothetical protein